MNWLHCFWGMGAAISPVLMTQMILHFSWRTGYAAIAVVQIIVAFVVLATILKGYWQSEKKLDKAAVDANAPDAETSAATTGTPPKRYLTKRRHKVLTVLCCFIYGGIEYSTGFWISSVLLESRGMYLGVVGMFPAVYYGGIMAGRFLFGFASGKLSNTAIIRIGVFMSFTGVSILFASGSIMGIALAGLGFAPIFPCLIHETSKRFSPEMLTKLVGYELAAVGAGVAVLSSIVGQVLARVSLEALFPIVLGFILVTLFINEVLERNARLSRN
jgi:fucose permease